MALSKAVSLMTDRGTFFSQCDPGRSYGWELRIQRQRRIAQREGRGAGIPRDLVRVGIQDCVHLYTKKFNS